MIAKDYIGAMINANQIIYIDTASLMDVAELSQFIQNCEDIILNENRRIIVPQAVCLELARHLDSKYQDKRDKAIRVLELLKEHQDIFEVRNQGLDEDEVYRAFADAEILAELTRNKKNNSQLLITNDRALSADAFELNNQGSCHGHRIMVCFINKSGELRKCDCTAFNIEQKNDKTVETVLTNRFSNTTEKVNIVKKQPFINEPKSSSKEAPVKRLSIQNVLIPVGTYLLGVITGRYGKAAINAISSII